MLATATQRLIRRGRGGGPGQVAAARRFSRRFMRGFTIVELVVTMTISVVVVSFAAMFISAPVQGFADQARRLRLVDSADTVLKRMGRDVRRALPNSLRTTINGGNTVLEVLSTVDGSRYREQPPGGQPQQLDFASSDSSFNVIGSFTQVAKPFSSVTHYLSIYNVGVAGADAYELSNVITPAGTQIDIIADAFAGEDRISLSPAFQFAYGSPSKRVYLVDGPISYLCDPIAGTVRRYSGYTIAANQSGRDTHAELLAAGASAALMADRITGCTFNYAPGTAERAGMLSMQVSVSELGEAVTLLALVHVDNVP
jgi:MSHA biogenesis protein MshO